MIGYAHPWTGVSRMWGGETDTEESDYDSDEYEYHDSDSDDDVERTTIQDVIDEWKKFQQLRTFQQRIRQVHADAHAWVRNLTEDVKSSCTSYRAAGRRLGKQKDSPISRQQINCEAFDFMRGLTPDLRVADLSIEFERGLIPIYKKYVDQNVITQEEANGLKTYLRKTLREFKDSIGKIGDEAWEKAKIDVNVHERHAKRQLDLRIMKLDELATTVNSALFRLNEEQPNNLRSIIQPFYKAPILVTDGKTNANFEEVAVDNAKAAAKKFYNYLWHLTPQGAFRRPPTDSLRKTNNGGRIDKMRKMREKRMERLDRARKRARARAAAARRKGTV